MLSAAAVLVMVDIIEPSRPECSWGIDKSTSLFDYINARGNVPASHYQKNPMDLVHFRDRIRDGREYEAPPTVNAEEAFHNTADHYGLASGVVNGEQQTCFFK